MTLREVIGGVIIPESRGIWFKEKGITPQLQLRECK